MRIFRIFLILIPSIVASDQPDVVVITIDTLRADRLGCYGYSRAATPVLDQLSTESILFTNAVSHVPLTRPSHLSIFTGLYPYQHKVHDNVAPPLDSKIPVLADTLRKQGYRTAAFISSFVVNSQSGLQRGFEHYADEFDPQKQPTQFALNLEKRGDQIYREFAAWRSGGKSEPYFAWLHLYDPHFPYEPPAPFSQRFAERPYDGEVAYSDEVVGKLLKLLGPNTILIVTSDHGESLGDHGENAHSFFIYDSTLRVPLFIRWPGKLPGGKRIGFQTRLVDLFPTVLDLLNLPLPSGLSGISLKPWLTGTAPEPQLPSYCETFTPWLHFGWSRLHGVRSAGWKYIEAPAPELYNLANDSAESRNLFAQGTPRVRELRNWLIKSGAMNPEAIAATPQLDTETLEKLASLGYAGVPTVPAAGGPLADPKDKIGDFKLFNQLIREGVEAFQNQKYAIAAEKFGALRSKDIPSFEVHYYLGRSLLRLKSYDKARTELELAVQKLPHFLPAYRDLSEAWEEQRKIKEAENVLLQGLTVSPNNPLLVQPLAWLYQKQKNYSKAEKLLLDEVNVHPDDVESRFRLGAIFRDTGRTGAAIAQFSEITSRKPEDPEAHNQLGMLYGATGRLREAELAFRKATQLDPKNKAYQHNLQLAEQKKQSGSATVVQFRIIQVRNIAVADVILKKLRAGESWESLATNYSIHASSRSGQSVLELTQNEIEPALAEALAKLKPGEFSEKITTSTGVFILMKEP